MTNSRVGQGFVRHGYLDEFKSKRTLKRYVQYCLGGYLAEQIIFGQDNVSDGSRGDLTYVNTTVLKQFRENGLGGSVLQYSGGNLQPGEYKFMPNEEIDQMAADFILEAQQEAISLLKREEKLLLQIAKRLIEFPSLHFEEIESIAMEYGSSELVESLGKDQLGLKKIL